MLVQVPMPRINLSVLEFMREDLSRLGAGGMGGKEAGHGFACE